MQRRPPLCKRLQRYAAAMNAVCQSLSSLGLSEQKAKENTALRVFTFTCLC